MKVVLASVLAIVGCGTSASDPYGEGLGDPENPIPQQSSEGAYTVANRVDFTVEAVLPAQLAFTVETLRAFSENPASALFDLAEAKGVPAVGLIRAALPGVLEDKLEGWINDAIDKPKIHGKTIREYAGEMAHLAEFALTQFQIDSEMTIDGYDVTHTFTALDLSPTGIVDVRIPIGGLAADILTQHPTLAVAEGGAIAFGDQHFGLQYGEYAWRGVQAASVALFGGDIRTVLGNAVNCAGLAQSVADKCVLGACVGHESELKSICTGGLDALVDFAHDRFAEHRLDAFQFASGTARLVDDSGDGVGDRIVDGEWDAKMNLGQGLRHAPATFEGRR
jgi:hypothetical protein